MTGPPPLQGLENSHLQWVLCRGLVCWRFDLLHLETTFVYDKKVPNHFEIAALLHVFVFVHAVSK